MSFVTTSLLIGGIPVDVYSHPSCATSSLPVHALFVLHGRTQSAKAVEPIINGILDYNYSSERVHRTRDLIAIAFDHRNHGRRLMDAKRNEAWSRDPSKDNPSHAGDMYTIQVGTALDVSFLIDHIPSFLYPLDEKAITEWGIAGISLGGHSTWIALAHDARLKIGIPIIGCPDYTKLLEYRAHFLDIPLVPPHYPRCLEEYVSTHDPARLPYRSRDKSNPFLDKKILVLSGGKDKLVPWSASEEFVEGLEVGNGAKLVVVEECAKHEYTPTMAEEVARFIGVWLIGK